MQMCRGQLKMQRASEQSFCMGPARQLRYASGHLTSAADIGSMIAIALRWMYMASARVSDPYFGAADQEKSPAGAAAVARRQICKVQGPFSIRRC